jgi:hypothetical protein
MKKIIQINESDIVKIIKRSIIEQDMDATTYANKLSVDSLPQANIQAQLQQPRTPENLSKLIPKPNTSTTQQQQIEKRVCPTGYSEPLNGIYGRCSGGNLVKKLQTYLGFTGNAIDGKFGINTENALKNKLKTTTISADNIKKLPIGVAQPASKSTFVNKYNPAGPLTTLNRKIIKISNSTLQVLSIYARYDRIWAGEFTIYINTALPGSFGSKKYTYATKCSLLAKNELQIPKIINTYKFNDPNSAKIISNHFCVAKK